MQYPWKPQLLIDKYVFFPNAEVSMANGSIVEELHNVLLQLVIFENIWNWPE